MIVRRELMVFEQSIQFLEVAPVKGNHGFGLENGLVQLQFITLRQRPEEATQPLDVASLLQYLKYINRFMNIKSY